MASAGHGQGRTLSLFAYGFRPFFLAAGLAAVVLMLVWLAMSGGAVVPPGEWAGPLWHGHEMIFGFAVAVLAGFMLAAVPNWVGGRALSGWALGMLFALWLAGRVVVALAGVLPDVLVAIVDCAFPLVLAGVLAPVPLARRQWRNLPLLALLAVLALTNLRSHSTVVGWQEGAAGDALRVAVDIVVLFVIIMGGRIVPAFTRNLLREPDRDPGIRDPKPLVAVAITATVAMGLADTVAPDAPLAAGIAALVAGLASAGRLFLWRGLAAAVRGNALLWVLHVAYGLFAAGLFLRGASALTAAVPVDVGAHVLTVGAVGLMILAMTSRVSLGHTGRSLRAANLTVAAYGVLIAATVARALAPVLPDGAYIPAVHLSGGLWALAFGLFLWVYAPILTTRRPDGRPG